MLGAHSIDGLLIPINTTAIALVADGTIALGASDDEDIELNASCTHFTIKPSAIPAAPIFIKFGTGAAVTATATDSDVVLTECEPTIHYKRENKITHISLFSTSAQTIYLKQYSA